MLKISTEFRKGIMFVRIKGALTKQNITNIRCEDFKYVVFNFDNLLSIDSYSISYIIDYNRKITNNNGKLIICDTNLDYALGLFTNNIPIIDNEIKAFNFLKGEAMDELTNVIIQNENLIYSVINKYSNYYDIDDLYQVGVMGIIKAYNNYNKDYNTKFTSYAYTYIFGEVVKYINDSKSFKISKENRGLYKKINEAKTILTQKLMKEPSNYELSLFLEIDEKLIEEVFNINQTVDSLDREIMQDGKKIFLYDVIGSEVDNIENIFLYEQLDKLTKDELKLLRERYFLDKTQSEVAKELGVNQVKISRDEQKILKKLSNNYQNLSQIA